MGGETSESDLESDESEQTLSKDQFYDEKKKSRSNKKFRKTIMKAKHRSQKYRADWEKVAAFRLWLVPDKSSVYKAKCRFCDSSMKSEISIIKRHGESSKHIERCTDVRAEVQKNVDGFTKAVDNKVQQAEILLCGFLAVHNLPFSVMDHLSDVLKKCFTDSKVVQSLKLKRTKATGIVKNVIGETQKERLIEKLKHTQFSILTDESTDIAATKTACIVVRFYDKEAGYIISQFWDLVQVFGRDKPTQEDSNFSATAEHLFSIILDSFDKYGIPRESIIGFGSDGCNTMMGCRNSVASRFRETCPGIIIMKCVCHSLHLCASEACKMLPRICEDLARNIYNYFKNSSKRQAKLVQFQMFLDTDVHKMLHPSQTRWLSLASVVDRILEQWNALRLFFDYEYLNERLMAVEEVHKQLHNPFMKAYYLFLQWALPLFTNLNKYFQSERVVITSMHARVTVAYKDLLGCYMKRDYIAKTPLQNINPEATEEFIPISNLYLGVGVMKQIALEEVTRYPGLIIEFKQRCREFLSTGCSQIKKRYDFNDPVLSSIAVLTPEKALSSSERDITPSLIPLTLKMPRVSPTTDAQLQVLDNEWRRMPLMQFPEDITKEAEVDVFWDKVSKCRDSTGESYFEVLPLFALAALSIPHSNAQCERIFSKVNLIKTKTRNRLVTATITGSILSSECIKGTREDRCCQLFEPTKVMYNRMTAANLYSGSKPEESSTTAIDEYLFSIDDI